MKLASHLSVTLEGKDMKIFLPPFEVKLCCGTSIKPDMFLARDLTKLSEYGYNGVPDVIIEVLPPDVIFPSVFIERDTLYRRHKVEFWAIDPVQEQAHLGVYDEEIERHGYRLYNKQFAPPIAQIPFLPGFFIDFSEILVRYDNETIAKWRALIYDCPNDEPDA
jgi:hypothetical protein